MSTGRRMRLAVVTAGAAGLIAALLIAGCASSVSTTTSSTAGSTPTTLSVASTSPTTAATGDVALGRIIYLTGADLSGQFIPRTGGLGMMGSSGCVTCHRPDGKGGTIRMMMASYDIPDIRWSTISQPMQMDGETEPPYDPDTFARAVREGIGSDGDELESVMPRWQLTDPQVQGLIAYLETL